MMNRIRFPRILCTVVLAGASAWSGSVFAASEVDPSLPEYSRVSGISGNLTSIGSDTLNNLMTLWAEEFNQLYPSVNIQIQGAGSSTAPPALTEGTATLAPMSRGMRQSEIEQFEDRFGYPPTRMRVAIDMVGVYVNRDNPIEALTIPEVDAIFSATRNCGYPESINRWGDLGLEDEWANRDFALYSRNAVSGTYGYFKENALCGGDYRSSINEQPGSSSVVQGVNESLNGIGYSGIGYQTSGVRAVPIARDDASQAHAATPENALNGDYPLARFLYVYINKHPNRELDPMIQEFMRMVYSRLGQQIVVRDGYVPLPNNIAEQELEKLAN